MVIAQEDKAGVWGQAKWLFRETIKVEVHQRTPLDRFTSSNKKENIETTEFLFIQTLYQRHVIVPVTGHIKK